MNTTTTEFLTSHTGDVITHNETGHGGEHGSGVHVVLFDFEHVAQPMVVVLFVLAAMLLKLGSHILNWLNFVLIN